MSFFDGLNYAYCYSHGLLFGTGLD